MGRLFTGISGGSAGGGRVSFSYSGQEVAPYYDDGTPGAQPWVSTASLPYKVEGRLSAVGDKLYSLRANAVSKVYDITTDLWEDIATPSLVGKNVEPGSLCSDALDGKIYSFVANGGGGIVFDVTTNEYVRDTAGTETLLTTLVALASGHQNGKIIGVRRSGSGNNGSTFLAYTPSSNNWVPVSGNADSFLALAVACNDNGFVYAFGGPGGGTAGDRAFKLDPQSGVITALPNLGMPIGAYGYGMAVSRGAKVYVTWNGRTRIYDTVTNTYSEGPGNSLTSITYGYGGGLLSDRIVAYSNTNTGMSALSFGNKFTYLADAVRGSNITTSADVYLLNKNNVMTTVSRAASPYTVPEDDMVLLARIGSVVDGYIA